LILENSKPLSTIDVTLADVASGIVGSLRSSAEKVYEPTALSVTDMLISPSNSARGPGTVALSSDEVTSIMLVTVVTVFHVSSQARMVMVKGTPTVWVSGDPALPVGVSGASISPGSRTCNCE
jgi:hypothetical protein